MNALRIKALIVAALMVASVAGATAWRPTARLADQRPKVALETLFPKQFGDWRTDENLPVQLVSPDTQALLSKIYNQTLSRTYVDGKGRRIMLSVAYGGDQSDATRAHRPEVCYPAQGFQVLSSALGTLDLGGQAVKVRRLHAQQGARSEPITYWIVVGDRITVTGFEQKLAQLSYSTRGVVPDGMLVRVSSIDRDVPQAYALQQEFVQQLALRLPGAQRAQVVGAAVQ
ncbi:exosortase-associated protein EpsI, B-type [Aquabacterium sp. OR-4]|uniref:exosortase-associated protein EpsI, B-type n=1 Tax=Aquabacterium sp. OR-4 TaxID=2978127 RepID=UPI0021B4629A|nr:exosortase-associated protein EpsI, B-type [Aquabacterium sp. OR-4]MDT7835876.1 EpsI family protein [Aquabacterium sp. OR-4]